MSRIRHASKNEDESEIDLTPMLDVVFIMLIFFIVTASFIKEFGLEINRPDDLPEVDIPTENQNILVNINASSEILVDQRRVDVRSIRSVIQRKLAENPKGTVIISAHKEARAETYASVADAAQQAKQGIPVTLVVKEE
jgi:biopolymer transport protein ExbD